MWGTCDEWQLQGHSLFDWGGRRSAAGDWSETRWGARAREPDLAGTEAFGTVTQALKQASTHGHTRFLPVSVPALTLATTLA